MSEFDWESAEPVQGINALQSQSKGGNSLMLDIASLLPVVPQGAVDWAEGVQHRMAHPLEALSDVANQWKNMSPVEMAANVLPVGATAWHGSPHLFDKFKNEAIGTGEGAQAYGHGLYLAEKEGVARFYARPLIKPPEMPPILVNGKPITSDYAGGYATSSDGYDVARSKLENLVEQDKNATIPKWAYKKGRESDLDAFKSKISNNLLLHKKWLDEMDAIKDQGYPPHASAVMTEPNMYKTDIPDAHIDKMLDWDKPLSEQHPEVKKVLVDLQKKKVQDSIDTVTADKQWNLDHGQSVDGYDADIAKLQSKLLNNDFDYHVRDSDISGAEFYRQYLGNGGDVNASNILQQAGIPGIKYLDGSSRAAGEGTRNFVIFDPNNIRILERNGQPTGQVPFDIDSAKPVENP